MDFQGLGGISRTDLQTFSGWYFIKPIFSEPDSGSHIISYFFFVFVRVFACSCNIKQHLANNGRHAKNYSPGCQNLRVSLFRVLVAQSTFGFLMAKVLASVFASQHPLWFALRFWQTAWACHQLSPPLLPIHIWQYLRTGMPVEIIVAVIATSVPRDKIKIWHHFSQHGTKNGAELATWWYIIFFNDTF